MNVAGPKTTLTGLVFASWAQGPFAPPRGVTPAGALPEMQPSSPSSRSRSEVRTSFDTGPLMRTMTASSPKRWCSVCVAAYASLERPTSVSVAALGSRRSASAAPASARAVTARPTSSGRRTAAPMTAPRMRGSGPTGGQATGARGAPRRVTRARTRLRDGRAGLEAVDVGPDLRVLRDAALDAEPRLLPARRRGDRAAVERE